MKQQAEKKPVMQEQRIRCCHEREKQQPGLPHDTTCAQAGNGHGQHLL
jgi:hypothetical protein